MESKTRPANGRRPTSSMTIVEFYDKRSVFLTGGTGFLGKMLIEKLLRSCPGVEHIYVLVRPKRRHNTEQRLQELLKDQIFDRVRRENKEALGKIIAVRGNLIEPGLGISDEDEATLIEDVSVVFHSAATINFQEPFKNAVAMNLQGTQSMIQLCKKLTKLVAFVHVSTAFANCDRSETYERIYPAQQDPEKVLSAASWLSDELMNDIFLKTRGDKPNTYIYTKALAESLVESRSGGLPVAVVRPSIVVPSLAEPYPGWVDNPNGANGLTLAIGHGLLRSLYVDGDKRADVVPGDYVVNLLLASAWKTATVRETGNRAFTIYNYASGVLNPFKWGELLPDVLRISRDVSPFETTVLYPATTLTTNHVAHRFNTLVLQILPALLMDTLARWTGRPVRLMKLQGKLVKTQEILAFFTIQDWDFWSKNVPSLWEELGDEDKETFPFDIKTVDWKKYMEVAMMGGRTFFLGQKPDTISACRKKIFKLKRIQDMVKISSWLILLWFVLRLLGPLAARYLAQIASSPLLRWTIAPIAKISRRQ